MDDNNIQVLLIRADINRLNKNPQKAIDDITKVILLSPLDFKNYIKRGESYHKLGQFHNAIADFSKATKILEYNPSRNLKDYIENQILAAIPSI